MIYPVTKLDRIHPYKLLFFVIPHRSELLLAYGTWLIGKGRVRRGRDMFLLWISGRK
jgi:hypothetical protein